jgi:uncharacterized protein (TIGR02266 family)
VANPTFGLAVLLDGSASKAAVKRLIESIDTYFPSSNVSNVALSLSPATICLHFCVDFSVYGRASLTQLENEVKKSGGRFIELLRIPEDKRDAFRAQFLVPAGISPVSFGHLNQTVRPIEEHLTKLAASNQVGRAPATNQPSPPASAQTRNRAATQRQSPRYSVNLEVHFQTESDFAREHVRNISSGGIFVTTEERPRLNSELGLRIRLPNGQLLQTTARVVHHLEQPSPGGVGLAFNQDDPEFGRTLEEYLAGLEKK